MRKFFERDARGIGDCLSWMQASIPLIDGSVNLENQPRAQDFCDSCVSTEKSGRIALSLLDPPALYHVLNSNETPTVVASCLFRYFRHFPCECLLLIPTPHALRLTVICNSFNCCSVTSPGVSSIRSVPAAVLGKAITSRMLVLSAKRATRRSMPSAMPPWGGAP